MQRQSLFHLACLPAVSKKHGILHADYFCTANKFILKSRESLQNLGVLLNLCLASKPVG
jgi:hypothetical protein